MQYGRGLRVVRNPRAGRGKTGGIRAFFVFGEYTCAGLFGDGICHEGKAVLTEAEQRVRHSRGTQPTGPYGSLHEKCCRIFQVTGECFEEPGPQGSVNDAMINRHRDIHYRYDRKTVVT